ncbi:MAG: disulfide bond formation protein DsbA [Acidimicrobiia bacterium]|nr:disulfide bond formation protein DsbA [Acidimicrobiia bacterium]
MSTIDFHFDAICPYTWITSRWLVEAAGKEDIEIRWRPMSLAILNDQSADDGGSHEFSRRVQRVMHHLHEQQRHDEAGVIYTAIGEKLFLEGVDATPNLIDSILEAVGHADLIEVSLDNSLDDGVDGEHERAMGLVGKNVGTPTIVFEDGNAIFGPVVNPAPKGDEAVRLLHLTRELVAMDTFFELKRTRIGDLDYT